MATVLNLKELRTSNTLKSEISKLEEEKKQLLDKLELQKSLEKKLREDILGHKKDFEHLEKQFDHFAGLETELEALQHEKQMERLENMIEGDKKESQHKNVIKKAKEELRVVEIELKELKKLDPVRLRRQVVDLKKKTSTQATENNNINKSLVSTRKELKEITAEKEKLDADLSLLRTETNHFWQSKDGEWSLFETGLVLSGEKASKDVEPNRIKCLNMLTGASIVSKELGKKDMAVWMGAVEIPEEVSIEAGKRLKAIIADAEDED